MHIVEIMYSIVYARKMIEENGIIKCLIKRKSDTMDKVKEAYLKWVETHDVNIRGNLVVNGYIMSVFRAGYDACHKELRGW